MTREEANTMLSVAKANYPNYYKNMTVQDKKVLTQTWAIVLHDIPADIALLAYIQLVSKSKWPPTPADIREQAVQLHNEAEELLHQAHFMDEMQSLIECTPSQSKLRLKEIEAISNSVVRRTDHLSHDLHGNDNGLTLNDIINAALSESPADNREFRALLLPYNTRIESDTNT